MLITLTLGAAFLAGIQISSHKKYTFPYLTAGLAIVLSAAFIFQLWHPEIVALVERNATLIEEGQSWRLFTSFFFQDGGIAGFIFNIIAFAVIGSLAERIWNRAEWTMLLIVSVLAAQCVALYWQPMGAGNSIGVFGLAGSLCAYAFFLKNKRAVVLATISVLFSILLVFTSDIHSIAFFTGLFLASLLLMLRSSRTQYNLHTL